MSVGGSIDGGDDAEGETADDAAFTLLVAELPPSPLSRLLLLLPLGT